MRAIAWIGILVFLAAWFCPAHETQDFFKTAAAKVEAEAPAGGKLETKGGDLPLPEGPSWLPGWEAVRVAWKNLTTEAPEGTSDGWKARVVGSTCLTNALMILAILLLLGQRSGNPLMGLLILAAAGLNASWIYLSDDPNETMKQLKIGYWLWAGSFALVGLGLMAGRGDGNVGYVQRVP
jgi:hypothetical protein